MLVMHLSYLNAFLEGHSSFQKRCMPRYLAPSLVWTLFREYFFVPSVLAVTFLSVYILCLNVLDEGLVCFRERFMTKYLPSSSRISLST